jgi:hypothetical protein
MKKFLFIATIASMVLSFASCEKTKEEQLKDMIEARLDSTMNNPDSYEFVSMTPIDSVMSKWEEEVDAEKIKLLISIYDAEVDVLNAKADNRTFSYSKRISFAEKGLKNIEKIDSLKDEYIKKSLEYVPFLTGFYTTFKFRGENAFGAIVLNAYKVTFNKELTEIKSMELIE